MNQCNVGHAGGHAGWTLRLSGPLPWLVIASAAAVGLANSPALSQAESSQKIYGQLNMSLEYRAKRNEAAASANFWALGSNASRIGIKGNYKSSADTPVTLVYQLEYEVAPDDGDPQLKQRNSLVGIETDYGDLFAGYHDTPFKKAQLKVDRFNDTVYDIRVILRGENRTGPMLHYTSPELAGGLKLKVAFIVPGEPLIQPDEATSISAQYKYEYGGGEVQVAFSLDRNVQNYSGSRLGLQWEFSSGIAVGFISQSSERVRNDDGVIDNPRSVAAAVFSAGYKWGGNSVYLQTASSDQRFEGGSFFGTGYDYKFADNTRWYLWYGSTDATNLTDLDGSPLENALSTGLEVRF